MLVTVPAAAAAASAGLGKAALVGGAAGAAVGGGLAALGNNNTPNTGGGMDFFSWANLGNFLVDNWRNQQNQQVWDAFRQQQEERMQEARGDLQQGYNQALYGGQGYQGVVPLSQALSTQSTAHYQNPAYWAGPRGALYGGYGELTNTAQNYAGQMGDIGQQAQAAGLATGQDINQGYANRTATGLNTGAGINQAYANRTATGMGLLQGLGTQAARDINQAFDRDLAARQANLSARGLGSTTVGEGVANTSMRGRTDALGRLGEQLRREQLGYYTGLSGEELASRERQQGFGAGLTGEQLAAQTGQQGFANQLAMQRANLAGMGGNMVLGAMGNQLAGQFALGQARDQAVQQNLNNQYMYGMAPAMLDLDMAQRLAQFDQNVVYQPPYML